MTARCLYAERQVASPDRPAWSLELHKAHLTVVYLKIYIKALCVGNNSSQATRPFLEAKTTYDPPNITDLPSARNQQKDIRKNVKVHRESFLEKRAAAAAGNITTEQAINIIIQR
jgi:hypothetical protein